MHDLNERSNDRQRVQVLTCFCDTTNTSITTSMRQRLAIKELVRPKTSVLASTAICDKWVRAVTDERTHASAAGREMYNV